MTKFKELEKRSIGEVVTLHPELVKVFMDFGVDFCCGGDRNVIEAIEKDTDEREALIGEAEKAIEAASLFEVDGEKVTLDTLTTEQLITRIINNHHKFLRMTLPRLSDLMFKILDVHGDRHPELFEIHKIFGGLKTELEGHMIKEERQLFPKLLEGSSNLRSLIEELEDEHDVAGDALHELTDLTNHFTVPSDACSTYGATYGMRKDLVVDMYMHVHTENNVLFKRF